MRAWLRSLVPSLILIIGLAFLVADVQAQTRGRASGRDDDSSSRRSNSESTERVRTPSSDQESTAPREGASRSASRTDNDRTTPASRSRAESSSPANSRTENAGDSDAARSRAATTRQDRQQANTPRPTRERAPANTTPAPRQDRTEGTIGRDARGAVTPRSTDGTRGTVRGRDADRTAGRGRVVSPSQGRVIVAPPPVVVHPKRVRVDAAWPWVWRRQNVWSPRYRYRQRVVIDAGWLGRRYGDVVEVETTYRHRLRRGDSRRAEVDIHIERIAVFDRGRFIGEVDRIPSSLGHTRATIYRNGRVQFDRDIYLVGSRLDGFEIVSTRYYDGYILNRYDRRHGYRVGYLDFRRHRVVSMGQSRFFNPVHFAGHVPISLLPDDRGWLLDYGRESITGHYYNSRGYEDDYYDDWDDRYGNRLDYNLSAPGDDRLERQYRREITTNDGLVIELNRQEEIQRIDD